jgi:hypothetical protein
LIISANLLHRVVFVTALVIWALASSGGLGIDYGVEKWAKGMLDGFEGRWAVRESRITAAYARGTVVYFVVLTD